MSYHPRPANSAHMAKSCHWISLGTMATLTKCSSYDWLGKVQSALVLFAASRAWNAHEDWQDAWAAFKITNTYANLVAQRDGQAVQVAG